MNNKLLKEKEISELDPPNFILSNKYASLECKKLMKYFSSIFGKGIISGQHCNKATMPDIEYIRRVTGKVPAILGFDFLSYSSAIETPESTFECIDELVNNKGTVDAALYWAKNTNAIITFCWHWFSPLNGKDKSFYTKNTNFDLLKALIDGTEENLALIKDLDMIANELKKFKDNNIPILWRPLHEACGGWFWWGAYGREAYIKLYRLMYNRYVNYHKLNNLIWVWNSPEKDWYPGDDVVDINSADYYASLGDNSPLVEQYNNFYSIPISKKPLALGENGPIPNPELIRSSKAFWLWFMVWNNVSEKIVWNSNDVLKRFYNDDFLITLEDLPKLR